MKSTNIEIFVGVPLVGTQTVGEIVGGQPQGIAPTVEKYCNFVGVPLVGTQYFDTKMLNTQNNTMHQRKGQPQGIAPTEFKI